MSEVSKVYKLLTPATAMSDIAGIGGLLNPIYNVMLDECHAVAVEWSELQRVGGGERDDHAAKLLERVAKHVKRLREMVGRVDAQLDQMLGRGESDAKAVKPVTTAVVEIDGGCLRSVYVKGEPVKVFLWDWDCEEDEPGEFEIEPWEAMPQWIADAIERGVVNGKVSGVVGE